MGCSNVIYSAPPTLSALEAAQGGLGGACYGASSRSGRSRRRLLRRFEPLRAVSEAEGAHGEGSRRRPVCREASRWNAAHSMEDGEGFAPSPDLPF